MNWTMEILLIRTTLNSCIQISTHTYSTLPIHHWINEIQKPSLKRFIGLATVLGLGVHILLSHPSRKSQFHGKIGPYHSPERLPIFGEVFSSMSHRVASTLLRHGGVSLSLRLEFDPSAVWYTLNGVSRDDTLWSRRRALRILSSPLLRGDWGSEGLQAPWHASLTNSELNLKCELAYDRI